MAKRKKRNRRAQNNLLVLQILILVVVVLVVFEGRLIVTMMHQRTSSTIEVHTTGQDNTTANSTQTAAQTTISISGVTQGLAGFSARIDTAGRKLSSGSSAENSNVSSENTSDVSAEYIDNPKVVAEQSVPVDDSYFSDAVFIGDSRMEGFRNASGITQGTFLTSVGMTLTSLATETVSTSEGQITVYQGLSGTQYNKIYLMLGANDLGFYPMSDFLSKAEGVFETIHDLQPDAVMYICSVIYVEESKVDSNYSYVNNENVQTVNGYLLDACTDLSYCYYLNLNEIFGNGYHALIEGASADGVHLNAPYLQDMLDYLKTHYLVWETSQEAGEQADAEG